MRWNLAQEKTELLLSTCGILLTVVGLSPLIFHSFFASGINTDYHGFFKIFLVMIPIGTVVLCYRIKIDCLPKDKLTLFVLLLLLSMLLVDIHYISIDKTGHYFPTISNHQWQIIVHESIMTLDPRVIPHTYRFLPDSMVRFIEFFTGDFSYARSLYRHTFMFLLLFSIYYYARLHYSHEKALLTIFFYAIIYPVSIRFYAGQLTDPLSHLLFVLAFIFLDLNLFICFATAVLIGILAKESILIMVVYFFLFRWKGKRHLLKTAILVTAGAWITLAIRLWVVPSETLINDVFLIHDLKRSAWPHIFRNFSKFDEWGRQILFTVGIFIPFLVLAWRRTKPALKSLAVFLLVTLTLSNVLFGFLAETRNLIPAVIPLALISSDYLLSRFKEAT